MEPPAKRLRIPKSVDVDENDPDYIRKKQRAETVLKNKLENIFARYEHMPDSRSDEINMLTGELVVDRGHLRGLQRDERGWNRAQFLDDVISDNVRDGSDMNDEDSTDELAPPGLLKSPSSAREAQSKEVEQTPKEKTQIATAPEKQSPTVPPPPLDYSQLLNALSPGLQTPQPPQSLQNQSALLMSLGQVVLQAVSQALPQALSKHFDGAASAASADGPRPPAAPTPSAGQIATPASDPKWYFPQIPELSSPATLPQSSPIPALTSARRKRKAFVGDTLDNPARQKPSPKKVLPSSAQDVSADSLGEGLLEDDMDGLDPASLNDFIVDTPHQESPVYSNINRKYAFSREDDAYIVEQHCVYKISLKEIRDSRDDWKDWPIHAFYRHWQRHLKHNTSSFTNAAKAEKNGRHVLRGSRNSDGQLLTPKSIKQAKSRGAADVVVDYRSDQAVPVVSPSTFSEEDLELLSIAGDDATEDDTALTADEHAWTSSVPPVETIQTILPSVETSVASEEEHEDLQVPTPRKVAKDRVLDGSGQITDEVAPESSLPSSTRKKRNVKPVSFVVDSDSEDLILPSTDDAEHAAMSPTPPNPGLSDELNHLRRPRSEDESMSPGPSSFLTAPPPHTPKSAPQPSALRSSTSKSAPKPSNSALTRSIKAQWAKRGRVGTPQALRQKRSMPILKKSNWQEESEDELA